MCDVLCAFVLLCYVLLRVCVSVFVFEFDLVWFGFRCLLMLFSV